MEIILKRYHIIKIQFSFRLCLTIKTIGVQTKPAKQALENADKSTIAIMFYSAIYELKWQNKH